MSMDLMAGDDRVPEACTLPTAEQPLRRAAFDDLFAEDVLAVTQVSPQRVRLELRPHAEAAARAAGLAVQETGCCSFFSFELTMTDGNVALAVATTPAHESVLAALAARAESRIGARA